VAGEEQEGAEAPTRAPEDASSRRGRRIALALLLLAGAGTLTVWVERRPIAARFIDRELARRGVPARYEVAELGAGRQRLTNLVIGDPRYPDLVADWVETRTRFGLGGPTLEGVRAGNVRMRGRVGRDGRLSLGTIDRLLPPPSGKPFALPDIDLSVADGRLQLATPVGAIGLRLRGAGGLIDGFRGQVAVAGRDVGQAGCRATNMTARLDVRVKASAPAIVGPVRVASLLCGGVAVEQPAATVDVRLSPALNRWRGTADGGWGRATGPGLAIGAGRGRFAFAGTAERTGGRASLELQRVAGSNWFAARVGTEGVWRVGSGAAFTGGLSLHGGVVRRELVPSTRALAGTPVGPVASAVAGAARRALQSFDAEARLSTATNAGGTFVHVHALDGRSVSGARVRVTGGEGIQWRAGSGLRTVADVEARGGGLPAFRTRVARGQDGVWRGEGRAEPYVADSAQMAVLPFRFTVGSRQSTIRTVALLSGPLASGRIDGLRVPLDMAWDERGRWRIGPDCTLVSFQRLRLGTLDLSAGTTTLCPTGPAIVTGGAGNLTGGGRLSPVALRGWLGGSPVRMEAGGGTLSLGGSGFTLREVALRLGPSDRESRLNAVSLAGHLVSGGVAGRVEGLAGKLAAVPLLAADGGGDWSVHDGRLAVQARATVTDAQAPARFEPLLAQDLRLTLADGRIDAAAMLLNPPTATRVALATIRHDLGAGTGSADLDVPGIAFGDRLQPEALTRLTFGVIAEVKGIVAGKGRIDWSPAGVTSTGRFGTAGLDLAAAFGPVTGVKGDILFTDLLALASAPDQVVTVASINPGVPVTDGVVRYQTLPGSRVAVRGARWPFAGGTLTLEPTLLDFSQASQRRLTFRVNGIGAAPFLQQFDFDNLDATGTFDGVLPMIFDETGGRIEGGALTVREGGGTIAYVGELGRRQLGFWGDLAFQSLRSLRYRSLDIRMNGPLAGEMVTDVRFAGVSQGKGARANFLIRRLQRLPLLFNVRITAPFRGLLDSAQSFYDPSRLIQRNLPALLERQNRTPDQSPVQPPASERQP